jgi:succinyl-diaminopimelate desuccinylase
MFRHNFMDQSLVELLQSLVRIPSPNPPGDTQRMAAFVADWMRNIGAQVECAAPPEKPEAVSVIATIGSGDPVILLHAHIDTVPIARDEAAHWHVDPYAAVVKDGKLYGKGSVDDKAPLAAMMHICEKTSRLFKQPSESRFNGTLVLVAAAEEEVGGKLGTRWLAQNGYIPKADFIVVGEQTHNRVATAHKGVLRATFRTTGKSVHATNPDRGINAITAMARIVLALESYHRELSARVHPLAGSSTCNVGVISGGSTANAVPDSCEVYVDRRMIPREDPEQVKRELEHLLTTVDIAPAAATVGDYLVSNWFESTCESALGKAFLNAVQSVLNADPGPIGYLPGSDAKHLTNSLREGGEMVIFGPGSYEVAHAYDEYVEIAELRATADILERFINHNQPHKEQHPL